MKKIFFTFVILFGFIVSQNSYALGHVSRDCPTLGAKESFTMSWFDNEWLYTYSVLLKKEGLTGSSFEWHQSGSNWEFKMRSAAGIHPWSSGNMDDYWSGVYGIHYWYNSDNNQVEERYTYIADSCDLLNWGINNW